VDPLNIAAAMDLPDLPDDEAALLAAAAQYGNVQARDTLIFHHLRLAMHMAIVFAKRDRELVDDLFQTGAMTLINCIDRYDPERGIPFRTWAGQQIRYYVWKVITKSVKQYRETIQAYLEALEHGEQFDDREAWFERLEDVSIEALEQGRIEEKHVKVFLDRARGIPEKQTMQEMGISRVDAWRLFNRAIKAIKEMLKDAQ
jgi:RNA polymerase sigma factor (sigma-70 family)